MTARVLGLTDENKDWLVQVLKDFSLEQEFYYENEGNEVEDISVEKLDIHEINVISVSRDDAYIDVTFDVKIGANVSYDDYDASPWDPEDRKYMFIVTNSYEVSTTLSFAVQIRVIFTEEMGNIEGWEDFELYAGDGFDLCTEQFPYK